MFKRSSRISNLIKEEISNILLKSVKDPMIGFVTITDVEVTDDLKLATIYFSVYGSDDVKNNTFKGLNRASGFIKKELGKNLKLKYIPEISFKFDNSYEYGSHIERILKELKEGERG
jgi:ribosome-binding factor A